MLDDEEAHRRPASQRLLAGAIRTIVSPIGRELRRRGSESVLHVFESSLPSILLDSLARGELDLVLAALVDEVDGLEATELMLDPYVLLVPADDPLARLERPVAAEDLAGRELVGKDATSPSQRALESTLALLGIDTTTRICAHDAKTVHALVGCGLGLAVLPRLLVDERHESTRSLLLDHLVPDRKVALYGRRSDYRAPSLALAEEILGELARAGSRSS